MVSIGQQTERVCSFPARYREALPYCTWICKVTHDHYGSRKGEVLLGAYRLQTDATWRCPATRRTATSGRFRTSDDASRIAFKHRVAIASGKAAAFIQSS